MSWKSLVTTGLLCVLASPVFAAPTLTLVKGGTQGNAVDGNNLDAAGNWVWNVVITPDYSLVPDASGTPVAAELGFTSTSNGALAAQGTVVSATEGSGMTTDTSGANANPGSQIFTWETLTDLGGGGACNSPTAGNCPVGLQVEPIGNDGKVNQIFSALGSDNATSGGLQYLQIKTTRPVVTTGNPNTSTTIQVLGAYSGNGRIAQITGGTPPAYTSSDFDTFGGSSYSFTRNARGGDANLDGVIDGADYNQILLNFNGSGKTWYNGDFDGTGVVDGADYNYVLAHFNETYSVGPVTPGAGAGSAVSSAVVPEPASIALFGLALLGGLGIIRRKR